MIIAHPTPETTPTLINYPPPTWLKHTPVFMLPYEAFDGPYASDTDTKYLSVGLAQWRYESDGDRFAVSVKAWRKPNDRWSRESEEIPVHRQVDMTILLAHVMFRPKGSDAVPVPAETFENQTTPLTIMSLGAIPSEAEANEVRCRKRLRVLRDVLNQLDPLG